MQKPEFAAAYRQGETQRLSLQSVARLQQASNAAVGTLLRVMTDRAAPAASRVRAADVVLQTALRGMQIEEIEARVSEFDDRLEAIEESAKRTKLHGRPWDEPNPECAL